MNKRPKFKVEGLPGIDEYSALLVKAALAEDIGAGDITTDAIINRKEDGRAYFLAKEDLVLAGSFVVEKTFRTLDRNAVFAANFQDGQRVKKGEVIAEVKGKLAMILKGERVALNFLQRMSGIATNTALYVKEMGKTKTKLLDTRKTTPCMRLLEKYAVKTGGGYNHRFGLFDSVLIKDNHISAAGSITEAVARVNGKYKDSLIVEVEVTNIKEVKEALATGAEIIMLDNMDIPAIKKAVDFLNGRALVEVSGGVNLENIKKIAACGVDFISVGGLTHSARAVDISMEVIRADEGKTRRSRA